MLFLWTVPLINDSHVFVKMRDEGDFKCGLWAMLVVPGIFIVSKVWLVTCIPEKLSSCKILKNQDNIIAGFEKLAKNLALSFLWLSDFELLKEIRLILSKSPRILCSWVTIAKL